MNATAAPYVPDDADRRLIKSTQAGLLLTRRPYHVLALSLGLTPADVQARLRRMLAGGVIRRIGAVPNHYKLGFRANGMSVWDVADDAVDELGTEVGALPFVSHCYRRVRHPGEWPYNLFAMVHGRTRDEVEAKVREIAAIVGDADRGHAVLYSTRILKKTGLRLNASDE